MLLFGPTHTHTRHGTIILYDATERLTACVCVCVCVHNNNEIFDAAESRIALVVHTVVHTKIVLYPVVLLQPTFEAGA